MSGVVDESSEERPLTEESVEEEVEEIEEELEDGDFEERESLVRDLNSIVLQYLDALGLQKCYSTFVNECHEKEISLPDGVNPDSFKGPFTQYEIEAIMYHIDNDEGTDLRVLWDRVLVGLEPSEELRKMTFFVRIFEALSPFIKDFPDDKKKTSMLNLRQFFIENNDEITTDENMLSLFALPFVPDPKKHPVFSNLFLPPWKEKFRSQILGALGKIGEIKKSLSLTDLAEMFKCCSRIPDSEAGGSMYGEGQQEGQGHSQEDEINEQEEQVIRAKNEQLDEIPKEIWELKENSRIIEERYYKLLKVTQALVISLEEAVQGKAQNFSALEEKIQSIFPELFSEMKKENSNKEVATPTAGANPSLNFLKSPGGLENKSSEFVDPNDYDNQYTKKYEKEDENCNEIDEGNQKGNNQRVKESPRYSDKMNAGKKDLNANNRMSTPSTARSTRCRIPKKMPKTNINKLTIRPGTHIVPFRSTEYEYPKVDDQRQEYGENEVSEQEDDRRNLGPSPPISSRSHKNHNKAKGKMIHTPSPPPQFKDEDNVEYQNVFGARERFKQPQPQ